MEKVCFYFHTCLHAEKDCFLNHHQPLTYTRDKKKPTRISLKILFSEKNVRYNFTIHNANEIDAVALINEAKFMQWLFEMIQHIQLCQLTLQFQLAVLIHQMEEQMFHLFGFQGFED